MSAIGAAILVTGATGRNGLELVSRLSVRGAHVRALVRDAGSLSATFDAFATRNAKIFRGEEPAPKF